MLNGRRHVKCYTHLLNRCYDLRVNEVSNYPIKHLYFYTCKFTNKSLARIESTVYRYATRLHNRYSEFTSEVERRELVVRRPHAAAPVGVFHPGGQRPQYWLQRARNPPWYVESCDSSPSGCDGQSGAADSWLKSGCDAPCDSDSGGCCDSGSWERRGGRFLPPLWLPPTGGRRRPRCDAKAAGGTGA